MHGLVIVDIGYFLDCLMPKIDDDNWVMIFIWKVRFRHILILCDFHRFEARKSLASCYCPSPHSQYKAIYCNIRLFQIFCLSFQFTLNRIHELKTATSMSFAVSRIICWKYLIISNIWYLKIFDNIWYLDIW